MLSGEARWGVETARRLIAEFYGVIHRERPARESKARTIPGGLHQQRLGEDRERVDGDLRALGPRPGGTEHHDAELVLTEIEPRE
jgi:hypothetical protein